MTVVRLPKSVPAPKPTKRNSSKKQDVTSTNKSKQSLQPDYGHSHQYGRGTTGVLPQQVREATSTGAISSNVYAADSPACAVTFAAPPTGQVYVTVTANNTTGAVWQSWEIRETNAVGTVIVAAADANAVELGGNNQASTRSLATGLTPGKQYYCRTIIRCNAGAGNVASRRLLVEAVI